MKYIVCLLVFISFLYSKEICIKNFDKQLCGNFKVLNSVVVKSKLSKDELKNKINKPIKQIAFLNESSLYLVDSNDSFNYSKELNKKDFIIYAQPNISQKRIKNSFKSSDIKSQFNLEYIWKSTKGKGINIAIIDDGFDLNHEDLKGVNLLFSYDVDNKNLSSSPKVKIDNHGTKVAGVIFAQHNNIGVDGIAPDANLIAIRQTKNITSDTILSFTVAQKAKAHIINCSWNSPFLLEPVYDVIKSVTKDTIIVFAAGNSRKEIKPYSIEASIPEVVTVATSEKYSNYGNIIDFVLSTNIKTTKVGNTYGVFSGTSASAPLFSGLLALKMSQNPSVKIEKLVKDMKKELYERR